MFVQYNICNNIFSLSSSFFFKKKKKQNINCILYIINGLGMKRLSIVVLYHRYSLIDILFVVFLIKDSSCSTFRVPSHYGLVL